MFQNDLYLDSSGFFTISPSPLKKGDTVAFVAPAGGLTALADHRLERGKT
jgi:muramoyltetrapeptide carboxypeptidase LdcA involved in peptidoglycan recycling